jgi:hypothetical protein
MTRTILLSTLLLTACTGTATMQGAKGDRGATGPQGPTGAAATASPAAPPGVTAAPGPSEVGIVGPQGATGQRGPAGEPGAPGAIGAAGATGPQGGMGPMGPQGLPGVAGPQGAPGANGSPGGQGPAGATGAQGIQGPTGPAGATGATGPGGEAWLFVSGSRLSAVKRTMTGSDGSIWLEWTGFHDALRGADCSPARAEDGKIRCLPRSDLSMGSPPFTSGCTYKIAVDPGGLAVQKGWALEQVEIAGATAAYGYRVYLVAEEYTAGWIYYGTPSNCSAGNKVPGTKYWRLAGNSLPTDWVAFQ